MMIPADPSPAKEPLVGGIPTDPLAGPPKPPPAPAADDQEEPAEELHVPRIPVVLLVFILIAIAALALIIMFWDVIEREGKKFLKRFDPPAPGVTGDGGQQQLIE